VVYLENSLDDLLSSVISWSSGHPIPDKAIRLFKKLVITQTKTT
jgi:hypothetical protein